MKMEGRHQKRAKINLQKGRRCEVRQKNRGERATRQRVEGHWEAYRVQAPELQVGREKKKKGRGA